jgi:arginine decarboxylase
MLIGGPRRPLAFRQRVPADGLISRWFTILQQPDLVAEHYRQSAAQPGIGGQVNRWNESWRNDEFVLDPTRLTLYIGNTGLNRYEFRKDVVMGRFGIQINKMSINRVLLIFTIAVVIGPLPARGPEPGRRRPRTRARGRQPGRTAAAE